MAVLGISCNWGAKRVSYAILKGTKNSRQKVDISDIRLSGDVGVASIDNLVEIWRRISDLCKIHQIERACLFSPGGWVTPRRIPGTRPADPMKIRMETTSILSAKLSGAQVEMKDLKQVASDLGLPLEEGLRGTIQSVADQSIPGAKNGDQRYAVAAALSVLR